MRGTLIATALFLALTAMGLVGCGNHYSVTTVDGTVYETTGQPDFNEDTRTYSFETVDDGREMMLPSSQVKQVYELER